MPLLTEDQVRTAARQRTARLNKSAPQILMETSRTSRVSFDVFLSHSIKDAEIVLGVVAILERFQLSVYVDWLIDPNLDRENVTAATAERIRGRILQSKSLLYLHTENSPKSRWMPWELGCADGHTGRVAILPVVKNVSYTFVGQEYLGIYPYIDVATLQGTTEDFLWVNGLRGGGYKRIGNWLVERGPSYRHG